MPDPGWGSFIIPDSYNHRITVPGPIQAHGRTLGMGVGLYFLLFVWIIKLKSEFLKHFLNIPIQEIS
jgi:hypothetical protein